jgi:CelD/BcsL family acetyltransferase involved in cellulose biosynthesis
MLKAEKISTYSDFLKLREIWNDVLGRTEFDNVFMTYDWIRCWWESFGEDKELFIILVKDEHDKMIAIAPLMISEKKYRCITLKAISFIKDDNASHADFLITERYQEVFKLMFECINAKKEWDIAIFEGIFSETHTWNALTEFLKDKGYNRIFEQYSSPYLQIDVDWKSFLAKKSSRFRKTMRNELNRLNKLGKITINELTHSPDLKDIVNEIAALSSRSWKKRVNGDMGKNSANLIFYQKLSEIAQELGWLSIWVLKADNEAIAMEYHLKYKNKVYALRGDFDEKFKFYSPGSILEYSIIEKLFINNVEEYDMCGDGYEYKIRWTDKIRKHCAIHIFNRNKLKMKVIYSAETILIPFIKKIKKA